MITYPGLPGPDITPHLTREASRGRYSPGTEFLIGRISLVGNTGTYLDSPYHRYADGADLAAIPLERTADLPAVVARVTGAQRRGIDVGALAALEVRGAAVLLHTGDDARFGTPAYAEDAHFLTEAGAAWLAGHEAALVGIDAVNIDDAADGRRPAHSLLLAAGIPVVEHLTGLGSASPGRGLVHRRAAAHRGIRHHPGPCVRTASGIGHPAGPAGQFEDWSWVTASSSHSSPLPGTSGTSTVPSRTCEGRASTGSAVTPPIRIRSGMTRSQAWARMASCMARGP